MTQGKATSSGVIHLIPLAVALAAFWLDPSLAEAQSSLPGDQLPADGSALPLARSNRGGSPHGTVADAHEAPDSAKPAALRRRQNLDTVAKFATWIKSYRAANPQARAQGSLLGEGERLAQDRRSALEELIKSDPRQALALAVSMPTRQQLPASIRRHLETRVSGRGSLTVLAVDDFEHGTHEVRREARIGGRTYEAHVSGWRLRQKSQRDVPLHGIAIGDVLALSEESARPLEPGEAVPGRTGHEACAYCGKPAARFRTEVWADLGDSVVSLCCPADLQKLNARLAGDSGGTTGGESLGPPAPDGWTRGTKRLLFMRIAFPDDPAEPITADGAYTLMDQVNQWYIENSYTKTAIIAGVTPLLIMPQTKNAYAILGRDTLQTDARLAARLAGMDTDGYDLDILLFNPVPGANFAGWNGLANIGGKGLWIQGTTSAGVAAHELGHNFGLYHANFWSAIGDSVIGPGSTVEYANPFDTMGVTNAGIYQFNACYKNQLGWLSSSFVQTVTSSGTYRLYAYDVSQLVSGKAYALRIKKDSARNYWAEFRQNFTSNPSLQNGVLLNWGPWTNNVSNSLGGTTLLDTTPGTAAGNGGKDDSAVVVGRTFSDPGAGVFITPVGKGSDASGNWIDVQVNVGAFADNSPPALDVAADQIAVDPNVPVNFSATASDPDGDTLAYNWDFGDLSFGPNSPNATKSWSAAGEYPVRCTASDMKGGVCSRYLVVRVGSPSTIKASGRITGSGGQPLEGVRVHNGLSGSAYRGAYTDSDGYYTLANLPAGDTTLSAIKYGYSLTPLNWTNPVSPDPDATGLDWVATPDQVVSVSALDASAAEPDPTADTAIFTISRTGPPASALTVKFNLNGTALYQTDYNLSPAPGGSPYQITLPAGVASTNLVVTPLGDSATEGAESAILTLVEDSAYVLGVAEEAVVTIADLQSAPKPSVSVYADEDRAPQSGEGSALFRFTRNGPAASDLTVYYSVGGTATSGVDYVTLSGAVTFPAGAAEALVPLTGINHGDSAGNKTVVVTVSSDASYLAGSSPSATVTIFSDYFTSVTIAASDSVAWEGTGDTGTFTVTRVGNLPASLQVDYSLGGTAVNGVDYVSLPGSVLIPAGANTATITVTPIADSLLNGKRSVIATLINAPGCNVGSPGVAQMTIQDDVMPGVSLEATSPDAAEAGPVKGEFTFTRTGSLTNPLKLYYTVFGTATNGADYLTISNSIVIPAGASSVKLVITPVPDSVREGNESVVIVLQDDSTYNVSTATPQTVTIADGNAGGLPGVGFDQPLASGFESGTVVPVVVSLSAPSTGNVTVNYSVTGGTATGGFEDYYLPSGQLTFAPGQMTRSFTFFVLQDSLVEPDETILISLSSPANALLDANSNCTFTIKDDDGSGAVTITALAPNASEAGPIAGSFRISRSGGTSSGLTVSYQAAGTASAPSDYAAIGHSAIIPAGQSSVDIVVTPVDDNTPEPTESVTVRLTSVAGASIGTPNNATIWIADDDSNPIVSVAASDPSASEGGPALGMFTFTRSGPTGAGLVVQFGVAGTATAGLDYSALPASVTIPAGAASVMLPLVPIADGLAEGDETVDITIVPDAAHYAIATGTATVVIADIPVDNWRHANFGADANNAAVAGDLADPDCDGLRNLLEYGFGTDPLVPDPGPEFGFDGNDFILIYRRSVAATDVILSVQSTTNFVTWMDAGESEQILSDDGTTRIIRAQLPDSGAPAVFYRIEVTRSAP